MGCTSSKSAVTEAKSTLPATQKAPTATPVHKSDTTSLQDGDEVHKVDPTDRQPASVKANGSKSVRDVIQSGSQQVHGESGLGADPAISPTVVSNEKQASETPAQSAYHSCPVLANDETRSAAVCGITNKAGVPGERFDDITKLLCQIFHVKIASVSLLDDCRQLIKSGCGLPPDLKYMDKRDSFCAWTLLPEYPEVLVVPDALLDMRFAENPLVLNAPNIRFYAGAPLVTSTGDRVGTVCIVDDRPRELEAQSLNVLINFAEVVVRELEKESAREMEAARLSKKADGLLRAFDSFSEGIMVCDSSTPQLEILFLNDVWCKMTGMVREDAISRSVWDIFEGRTTKAEVAERADKAIRAGKPFNVELQRRDDLGMLVRFTAMFRPGVSDNLDEHMPQIAIPGAMSSMKEDGVSDNLYFCTMQTVIRSAETTAGTTFREAPSTGPAHPFPDVQLGPLLGQGSFGRVYRGVWNGAYVAVKIIVPPVSQRTSSTGEESEPSKNSSSPAFEPGTMECSITAQLQHPNVVMTYKSAQVAQQNQIQSQGQPRAFETWMVLEYCDSGTLRYAIDRGKFDKGFADAAKRTGEPDLAAIRSTSLEIAAALCYLHTKDILHGDLCSGNILLSAASRDRRGFVAKVADFGLSRSISATVTTATYGTVTHMPPELLTDGTLSKATDAYSFGAILWELFSIDRPWCNMLPMQVMYNVTILKKSLKFPATTPKGYADLGALCMDSDPGKRPSMPEVVKILEALPVS